MPYHTYDIQREALRLARLGVRVMPVRPDKRPCFEGWQQLATVDAETIRAERLWRQPWVLLGVPTGAANGFSVIDVDPRHGGLDWLQDNVGRIPLTRIHMSKSHGFHIYFKHRAGIRNSVGRIAPGVDVRGDHGFIIWWPAAGCEVIDDTPLHELAPWPDWIKLPPAPEPRRGFDRQRPIRMTPRMRRYAAHRLEEAIERVANSADGTRNMLLNIETFKLAQLGLHSPETIANAMTQAAQEAGLDQEKNGERRIVATIASALRAGGIA